LDECEFKHSHFLFPSPRRRKSQEGRAVGAVVVLASPVPHAKLVLVKDPALAKYVDVIAVGVSGVNCYTLKRNGALLVSDFVNPQNKRWPDACTDDC
jgi:hypothetical protein